MAINPHHPNFPGHVDEPRTAISQLATSHPFLIKGSHGDDDVFVENPTRNAHNHRSIDMASQRPAFHPPVLTQQQSTVAPSDFNWISLQAHQPPIGLRPLSIHRGDSTRGGYSGRASFGGPFPHGGGRSQPSSSRPQPHPPPKPTPEKSIIHQEDPETKKARFQAIMDKFDEKELFGVEEWDTRVREAEDATNEPEPLTAEPQRVSYTTVGSVVKSNAAPKFTAPNRIQREGAQRRLPLIQPPVRGHDNFYHRNQLPQTNLPYFHQMAGQMAAPRQIANTQHQSMALTQYGYGNIEQQMQLNILESDTLNDLNDNMPTQRSGNAPPQMNFQQKAYIDKVTEELSTSYFGLGASTSQEVTTPSGRMGSFSGLSGLDKMQTLQRLARFDNPVQDYAKERLAHLAVARLNSERSDSFFSTTDRPDLTSANSESLSPSQRLITNEALRRMSPEERNFSLGRVNENVAQNNQYYAGVNYNQYNTQGHGLAAPPGYPQPLTAGPPGQRQSIAAVRDLQWEFENRSSNMSNFNAYNENSSKATQDARQQQVQAQWNNTRDVVLYQQTQSPWNNTIDEVAQQQQIRSPWNPPTAGMQTSAGIWSNRPSNPFSSFSDERNRVRETLSLVEMAKYYPNGLPKDMRPDFTRMDPMEKAKYMGEEEVDDGKTAEQKRLEKLDKWFYSGLNCVDMTIEDYDAEMQAKNNPMQPPIQRPTKQREVLSIEQIREMTDEEVAKPLVNLLYGKLLQYADRSGRPESLPVRSGFLSPGDWARHIDEQKRQLAEAEAAADAATNATAMAPALALAGCQALYEERKFGANTARGGSSAMDATRG